jgi:hypothetical protein
VTYTSNRLGRAIQALDGSSFFDIKKRSPRCFGGHSGLPFTIDSAKKTYRWITFAKVVYFTFGATFSSLLATAYQQPVLD